MKALFLDCNDQLAPVWQRVVRPDDPPIDVNRKPYPQAELPRVLKGYDICIDDHSYMPTDLVDRCDALKHVVFLGTGPASYMSLSDLAARGIKVHTIRNYGDTAVAEHTIALMFADPAATPVATPLDPVTLLTVAADVVSEDHVAAVVRSWVLPSE